MISGESHDEASRLAHHRNHEFTPFHKLTTRGSRTAENEEGRKTTDPALGAEAVGTVNPDVLGDDGAPLVELQVFFKLWKC